MQILSEKLAKTSQEPRDELQMGYNSIMRTVIESVCRTRVDV